LRVLEHHQAHHLVQEQVLDPEVVETEELVQAFVLVQERVVLAEEELDRDLSLVEVVVELKESLQKLLVLYISSLSFSYVSFSFHPTSGISSICSIVIILFCTYSNSLFKIQL
jgi:hypothetical protein